MIIADAVSGWLETLPYTDRSNRNVVRCLRTTFSRFGISYTVLSEKRKGVCIRIPERRGCKKIYTHLYPPESNEVAARAVQSLQRSLKLFKKDIGCSLSTYIDKCLFSQKIPSNARGETPAKLLPGINLRNPVVGFYKVGEKVLYKPTSNHELKEELTYIIRKGRNTAWLHNHRTFLASDRHI